MGLEIFRSSSFKTDFKKLNDDEKEKLKTVLFSLINGEILEQRYKNHQLTLQRASVSSYWFSCSII